VDEHAVSNALAGVAGLISDGGAAAVE